jgi:hypothetical protein
MSSREEQEQMKKDRTRRSRRLNEHEQEVKHKQE